MYKLLTMITPFINKILVANIDINNYYYYFIIIIRFINFYKKSFKFSLVTVLIPVSTNLGKSLFPFK